MRERKREREGRRESESLFVTVEFRITEICVIFNEFLMTGMSALFIV